MGRMAACKDEIEGISEGKKEKHELKKEGKQVWETQWFLLAEMQDVRSVDNRQKKYEWTSQEENGKANLNAKLAQLYRQERAPAGS